MMSEADTFLSGTQIAIMQSPEVATRARARVQALKPDLAPAAIQRLYAYREAGTVVFDLQATGSEPVYTQAYLDAVMEEYINFRKETRSDASQSALAAVTEQLSKIDKEVNETEEQMLDFQKQNNVVLLEEQGSKNATYVVNLNSQLTTLNTEYQLLSKLTLDQNIDRHANSNPNPAATAQNSGKDPATATNSSSNDATEKANNLNAAAQFLNPENEYRQADQQIKLLRLQLDELSKKLKPKHPKIISMTTEIQRQETLLEMYKKQSIEQLDNRRESLRLQIENLQELIKSEETKALDVNRRMAEYRRMKEKSQRLNALRETLSSSINNIDITQNTDQEMISIMEHAGAANVVRVGMVDMLLNGAVMGLVAAVAILFLLDRVDDRVNSFSELRDHFEEPVLGQIPMDTAGERRHSRSKPVPEHQSPLLVHDDTRHIYAESYRNIRSSLLFMAIDGTRPKTLLVTSAIPNEGKSNFSANLAITMAFAGSRVLLIDADLRRGHLHDAFNTPNLVGLSSVLSGQSSWKDAIVQPENYQFDIIPRGPIPPNPGELFLSKSAVDIFHQLRDVYDYVIVDSAPILATDDTSSIAPKLDGTIFLTRTSYTSARLTRNALDLLYQRQVKVLGIVLNFVDTNLPEYYYYQYKEYYSRGIKAA